VGTGYFDEVQQVISGGLGSTAALEGSTENEQFTGVPANGERALV
jgi:isocitrate lyase